MSEYQKWPAIESFNAVAHNQRHVGITRYRGKIKLHGTHGAIEVDEDGSLIAHSRTRVVTTDDDNCGFAKWVDDLSSRTVNLPKTVLYGEWCGPGIQRGVAVNNIKNKIFAVYAALQGGVFITEPLTINEMIPSNIGIYTLPWLDDPLDIDFIFVKQEVLDRINGDVNAIEECDPWINSVFGIQGTGEGVVYYPVMEDGFGRDLSPDPESTDYLARHVFKAKGAAHRVNGHTEAAAIKAASIDGLDAFVAFSVTQPRLEQALFETCGDVPDVKKTGDFLKWVQRDISKECADELAAFANQGKILGACGSVAVRWYKSRC